MSYVYTIEYVDNDCLEVDHYVYASKELAYNAAIETLQEFLQNRGFDDPECPEYYDLGKPIFELITNHKYDEAIELYNEIPDAITHHHGHVYIYVHRKLFHTSKSTKEMKVITVQSANEKACCHCGKNNDVGVSECWWCGNTP
jgi:hypothetical protein